MSELKCPCHGGVRSVEDLLLRSVVEEETGCWLWSQSKTKAGAAKVCVWNHEKGRTTMAVGRRVALELQRGKPLPKGHMTWAKKHCPNAHCVNPDHARSGNRKAYGEWQSKSGLLSGRRRSIASRRSRAVLDMQKAREIRYSDERREDLAARYGVSLATVQAIKSGRLWKEHAANSSVFNFRPRQVAA